MESCAVYNRSLTNQSQTNVQEGQSSEDYKILAGPKAQIKPQTVKHDNMCYSRRLAAHDGVIVASHGRSDCAWPHGIYVCGNELCGAFSAGHVDSEVEMVRSSGGFAGGVSVEFSGAAEEGAGTNGTAGQCLLPMRRSLHLSEGSANSKHQVSCLPGTGRHRSAWADTPNLFV